MRGATRLASLRKPGLLAGTLLTVGLIGPWGSATAQGGCANADSGPEAGAAALTQAVECLIAAERAAAGLPPVTVNAALKTSALGHATDMVNRKYLAANSPEGTTPASRALRAGYGGGAVSISVGEAYTFGQGASATPRAAVAAWRADPDFSTVVLDPDVDDLGVGVVPGAPFPVDAPAATYVADFGSQLRPQLGRTVVATRTAGTVLVKPPGSRRFVRLTKRRAVRMGSIINASRGTVRIVSTRGSGRTQAVRFFAGTFKVTQRRVSGAVTDVRLTGQLDCARAGRAVASARKKKRRVWGDGKGRFRTRGNYGAATVVGTRWLTEDTCAGTRITVTRGTVLVKDLRTGRTRRVTAGQSVLLRAR